MPPLAGRGTTASPVQTSCLELVLQPMLCSSMRAFPLRMGDPQNPNNRVPTAEARWQRRWQRSQ
eukprot:9331369-Alexandrium_andersonii.AAC.1